MTIDLSVFQNLVDEKYISVQHHDYEPLMIYNYTQKVQFERHWIPETLMCRGLIVREDGLVVARPYDKFFNLEEAEVVSDGSFTAWDKMDGSLGILYWDSDRAPLLATRGSFVSDQAKRGTAMFLDVSISYDKFSRNLTYLFEIIYPENRIVVDYAGKSKLVFLGARDIETGKVYTPDFFPNITPYFESAVPIPEWKTPRSNAEGVVLYYDNGFMCKAKYDEYVRLHKLITGVNAKTIWEMLKDGKDLDELLERVPDEFYQWVKDTKSKLMEQFHLIEKNALEIYGQTGQFETRKDQAIYINGQNKQLSGIVFSMLDGKDYSEIIWRMIQPRGDRPFKEDIDL